MERFIGTDTASVELVFNIFISRIEKFVIPWDQLLYPCVVEVCRLGLEPLYDTYLCHIENADADRREKVRKLEMAGREVWHIGWMIKHLPAEVLQEMC